MDGRAHRCQNNSILQTEKDYRPNYELRSHERSVCDNTDIQADGDHSEVHDYKLSMQ